MANSICEAVGVLYERLDAAKIYMENTEKRISDEDERNQLVILSEHVEHIHQEIETLSRLQNSVRAVRQVCAVDVFVCAILMQSIDFGTRINLADLLLSV